MTVRSRRDFSRRLRVHRRPSRRATSASRAASTPTGTFSARGCSCGPSGPSRRGASWPRSCAEFGAKAVVSPALGGVVIGHETARELRLPAMFVERKEGAFALRRGFSLEPGTARRRRGGRLHDRKVHARGRCRRRSSGREESWRSAPSWIAGLPERAFSVPSRSLLSLSVPSWPESECPLCRQGVPIDAPGSRFQKT